MQSAAVNLHAAKRSVWTPLSTQSCIRILTLSKAGPNSFPADAAFTISCSLVEIDLDRLTSTADAFDAVSYVWGSPDETESIICNSSEVYIRRNLYLALCYIWSAEPQKRLWADAICIDQDDNEEKSRQVALMNQIYSKAQSVIVWLGEPDTLVEPAWEIIRVPVDVEDLSAWWSIIRVGLPILLKNEWFYRIWTYQELLLSRTAIVRCGQLTMAWNLFYKECLKISSTQIYEPRRDQVMLLRMISNDKGDTFRRVFISDFTRLLVGTRHRLASDPRDKIYAILGLPMFQSTVGLRPDYTKSISQTYTEATLECMRQDSNLSILSGAGTALHTQIVRETRWAFLDLQEQSINHRPGVGVDRGAVITLKYPIFSPDYLDSSLKHPVIGSYQGEGLPSWVPRFDQPLALRKVEEDGERAWSKGLCTPPFRAPLFRLHYLGRSLIFRGILIGTAAMEDEDSLLSFMPLPTCMSKFFTTEPVEPQISPADVLQLLKSHRKCDGRCLCDHHRDWKYFHSTILDDAKGGRFGKAGDWFVVLYGAFDHCILRPFEHPSYIASEGCEKAIHLCFTLVAMAERTWRYIKRVDLTQLPGIVLDFEIQ